MSVTDPTPPPATSSREARLAELIELQARDLRGHPYLPEGSAPFTLEAGRVIGHYHGLRLQTTLLALLDAGGRPVARLAQTAAFGTGGQPVSAWAPYAIALDDAAITYLDRLIRTVHVLNAGSRPGGGPLWLAVHPLHLAAVPDAHGAVFASILRRSGLRPDGIVLELADAARVAPQRLAAALAGFRSRGYGVAFGFNGSDPAELDRLLALAPDAIRLGAPHLRAAAASEAEQQRLRARIEHIHRHRVRVWLPAAADAREAALLPSLGADGWQAADASGSLP